jgi:hypothetical protein
MVMDPIERGEQDRESYAVAEDYCEECGHAVHLHNDKYGCQFERGDAWVTGNQPGEPTVLMAQGPCGCQAITFETVEDEGEHGQPFKPLDVDEFQEALRKYYEGLQRQPDPNEPDGETLAQSQALVRKLFGGASFCNEGRKP